jgi:tetratricopeptide (TPR) repeat protein
MSYAASFLAVVLLCELLPGFQRGDEAVVIQPVEMKTITGSSLKLSPGTIVAVREAETDRLKVAAGRIGWIARSAVVAAADADDYFTGQIEKNSTDAVALLARGKLRFERAVLDAGKLAQAIEDLDRSLKLTPSSEALTTRGFAYKRMGDKERAMADFNAAIELNPKEALAWRVRGATWASKGDYPKALADYSESIRIDPENPDSLLHRVVMLSGCKEDSIRDGKQAVIDATKACEVSEWSVPLYLTGLAFASAETGDFDAAIKWQQKAIDLSPRPMANMQANLELFRQHKPYRTT